MDTASLNERETLRLIASDKVQGTPVSQFDGTRIGTIHRVMIDKRTGRVAYVVMAFGGFLGIGEDYYPLPWSALRYSEALDAYQIDITAETLRAAPHLSSDEFEAGSGDWASQEWGQRVHDHYKVPPYWLG